MCGRRVESRGVESVNGRARMSILNYFKGRRDYNLPNPRGSLSGLLSPSAIASANKEVEALLKATSGSNSSSFCNNPGGKRGPCNR